MSEHMDREEYITVIGSNFLKFAVSGLIDESLKAYLKTDFSKKRFQTSVWEHSHAAAAIVLSVIGIEAFRNRIYCLKGIKVDRSVPYDLCRILRDEKAGFPSDKLQDILTELFVTRDVIVHNHIYQVEVFTDEKLDVWRYKQKLLKGYGFDSKYKRSVNSRTKKTKLLKLNVQPARIGFEDIFKVLVITDLLIGILQNILGGGYVPFHMSPRIHASHKISIHHLDSLSKILNYYYEQIPRRRFITLVEELSRRLRNDFANYLPPYPHSSCFISNICPKCSKLGFDRYDDTHHCRKCGLRMGFIRDGVIGVEFTGKDTGD
jgi:hypothetical protein